MLFRGKICRAWLLIFALFIGVPLTETNNILAILPYALESPYLLLRPLIKALVDRGHQVTVISAEKYFPYINGTHHIREPRLDTLLYDMTEYTFETSPNKWKEAIWLSRYYYYTSHYILNNNEVQKLLHNSSAQFDLVITDTPHLDALSGFAKHFNAPLVGIAAFGSAWIVDYLAGNPAPTVYDPISPVGYSYESSSLLSKWFKWIYMTEEWLLERLVYLPPQIKLYKKHFHDSHSNFNEIRRNFSLILVNQHFSLGRVRSNVPNLIEVAGMHMCMEKDCELDPMSEDLQKFMDEAQHGVIYFSMGLEIMMEWLPQVVKEILFQVFSKQKQRVIWKYDNYESFGNKSDNVYVRSYLPQQQILRHPNVKLFITHGGLLSLIEAAYYSVPVLNIPLYYDQFLNAQRMRLAGVGQTLDLNTINAGKLNQSIHELLQNPFYKRNALKMSSRFRDQPMNPLDTAVWWTEYILRQKGAPHMRLAEHDMSFVQYYYLDLLPILFGRIGLTAMTAILLVYKVTSVVITRSRITLRASEIHL